MIAFHLIKDLKRIKVKVLFQYICRSGIPQYHLNKLMDRNTRFNNHLTMLQHQTSCFQTYFISNAVQFYNGLNAELRQFFLEIEEIPAGCLKIAK